MKLEWKKGGEGRRGRNREEHGTSNEERLEKGGLVPNCVKV